MGSENKDETPGEIVKAEAENSAQAENEDQPEGIKQHLAKWPKLQEQINRIVEGRLKREREGFEKKLQEKIDVQSASYEEAMDGLKTRLELANRSLQEKSEGGGERNQQAAQAQRAKLEAEAAKWEERFKSLLAKNALADAAAKAGAYKPDQVVALLTPHTTVESDDKGDPRIVLRMQGDGEAFDEFRGPEMIAGVQRFLSRNPNLRTARSSGGAGSAPGLREPDAPSGRGNSNDPMGRKARKSELERLARQRLAVPTKP